MWFVVLGALGFWCSSIAHLLKLLSLATRNKKHNKKHTFLIEYKKGGHFEPAPTLCY